MSKEKGRLWSSLLNPGALEWESKKEIFCSGFGQECQEGALKIYP